MVDIKYLVLTQDRAAVLRAYWPDGYTQLSGQGWGMVSKMLTLSLTRHRKPRKVARRFREAHSLVSEESAGLHESVGSYSPSHNQAGLVSGALWFKVARSVQAAAVPAPSRWRSAEIPAWS